MGEEEEEWDCEGRVEGLGGEAKADALDFGAFSLDANGCPRNQGDFGI